MKKLISTMIVLCIFLSVGVCTAGAYTLPDGYALSANEGDSFSSIDGDVYGYVGDVDENGKVNVRDATTIQKSLAKIVTLSENAKTLSDVDFSGAVNVRDATAIQKWLANIAVDAPIHYVLYLSNIKSVYTVGETWVVDDQWEFTINSVTVHNLCNSYSNNLYGYSNEQVVNIDYTFKNIGYSGEFIDLYFSSIEFDVYDGEGETAKLYACTHTESPKECIVGTKCTAQESYILNNSSSEITVKISKYPSNAIGKQSVIYSIPIESQLNDNKNSVDLLSDYIVQNGEKIDDTTYCISSNENTDVFISYDTSDNSFMFVQEFFYSFGGSTLTGVFYVPYEIQQNVVSIDYDLYGDEVASGNGYIYADTFSSTNDYIYSFTCTETSEKDEYKSMVQTATSLLLYETNDILNNTGLGITLYDLGFTAF